MEHGRIAPDSHRKGCRNLTTYQGVLDAEMDARMRRVFRRRTPINQDSTGLASTRAVKPRLSRSNRYRRSALGNWMSFGTIKPSTADERTYQGTRRLQAVQATSASQKGGEPPALAAARR